LEIPDSSIDKLRSYLEAIRGSGRLQETKCPSGIGALAEGLPVGVGPVQGANIILKEDTAVELGSPDLGSCAFVLTSHDTSLVRDGVITLVGPDVPESVGRSLPFAQVLLVAGNELRDQHHLVLEQHHMISNRIEGYMVRLAPQRQRMWTRVSKSAVEKGFTFETLGRALMAVYKSELPIIEAAEVVFVTSSSEDVEGLKGIAAEVQKERSEALSRRFKMQADGTYECTSEYVDCRSCPDEPICDEVRGLIRLRRKTRSD